MWERERKVMEKVRDEEMVEKERYGNKGERIKNIR